MRLPPETPTISVVMSVYNVGRFVNEAVTSLLRQSYKDFELIIVDDGSIDDTVDRIRGISDDRIRLIELGINQGVVAALNVGLDEALGIFVARMDGDDISNPQRFERQLAYLRRHPEIGILGTGWTLFGTREGSDSYRSTPAGLKASLPFGSPFSHPTVMFRRQLILDHGLHYDPEYAAAEDYEIWARFARVTEMANLTAPLFAQRIHPGSVSHAQRERQQLSAARVRRDVLNWIGALPDDEATRPDALLHEDVVRLAGGQGPIAARDGDRIEDAGMWLKHLVDANRVTCRFDQRAFEKVVTEQWYKLCRNLAASGLNQAERLFGSSPLVSSFWKARWRARALRSRFL